MITRIKGYLLSMATSIFNELRQTWEKLSSLNLKTKTSQTLSASASNGGTNFVHYYIHFDELFVVNEKVTDIPGIVYLGPL